MAQLSPRYCPGDQSSPNRAPPLPLPCTGWEQEDGGTLWKRLGIPLKRAEKQGKRSGGRLSFLPVLNLAPSSQGTGTGCQSCSLGHGVWGPPGSGVVPHGWQPAKPKDLCPWREQGLAIAVGWVAGGVTQQAGLVRVVSHCQLSLPGWDRRSHLASHWLHWGHQTTSRHEKTMKKYHCAPRAPHQHGELGR